MNTGPEYIAELIQLDQDHRKYIWHLEAALIQLDQDHRKCICRLEAALGYAVQRLKESGVSFPGCTTGQEPPGTQVTPSEPRSESSVPT